MSRAIHFVTHSFLGYGLTDGRFLPCSGVSRTTVSPSPCSSRGPYKTVLHLKTAPLKCTASRMSCVCNYSKNPDFSRQNKGGFSRNRKNREIDEGDGFESLEESDDVLSSENGALASASNPPRYQTTSTPELVQKEVLEVFRKVQAELRERAAVKGEKKTRTKLNRPQGKEDEPVETIIQLLRKTTTKKGKTGGTSSGSNRNFILEEPESTGPLEKEKSAPDSILDQSEQNGTFVRKESTTSLDLNNNVKGKAQGHGRDSPAFSRPLSNFQRRSPVPQVKHQPLHSDFVTDPSVSGKSERLHPDPEIKDPRIEMEPEPGFSDGIVFDGMSEEEDSDIHEGYSDDEVEEDKPMIDEDLSGMKMLELRALAKSRGIKGFSKLKKLELVELLSGGST